ncbi:MerR family transcriptional regulator [Janibacter anophelis]|uniref:MerR family transcriptional regulator n=1 Tax=Janibacter anophelis TaxID=319054 RepID=UPI000836B18F|nr:MerR family transcriptional regulator [Janibacter anophelis]
MTDTAKPMSIGQFSSRSRLSVRMLRHYGDHGILVPAEVDPSSGYRRYVEEQLVEAAHVRRLRDVGFTVSAISVLLAARGTESYRQALVLQRSALDDELRAARERLALIDQLLDQEGSTMSTITVTRETVPARTVVALRGTVPAYDQEGRLWGQLMPAVGQQQITPIGPCGVFEHDPEYRESDPTLSIWLPVPAGTTVEAPLEVHELPEQQVVMARVEGPYTLISEAHTRIEEHLRSAGLTPAPRQGLDDPIATLGFNRYLVDPSQAAPEDLVTEVCVPLA